jgi:hypothetical protein
VSDDQRLLPDPAAIAMLFPTAGIDAGGHYATRQLPDGRWLCVDPLTYQRARLCLSHAAGADVATALSEGYGYDEVWDYETREDAIVAMEMWDGSGQPTGWTRHPTRRR